MGINRRKLLTGATALAAMPNAARALTPAQQLVVVGQSGGAALPPGLLGFWSGDRYTASPHPVLRNQVGSAPLSANLMSAPRRLFATSSSSYWSLNGAAVTDANATAYDGTGDASTGVFTGAFLRPARAITLPAGTYTLAVWARALSGTPTFRMSFDAGAATTAKTASTSWQRFIYTATLTAGDYQPLPIWENGSALTLEFLDAELFAGSSHPGTPALGGHLYLGSDAYDTRPAVSGNVLDLSNRGFGFIQFPTGIDLSQFTTFVLAQKVGGGSGGFEAYLGIPGSTAGRFGALFEQAQAPRVLYNNNISTFIFQKDGLWAPSDSAWKMMGHRYNGSQVDLTLNDMQLFGNTASGSGITIADFTVAAVNTLTVNYVGYKVFAIGLYNRRCTDAEMRAIFDFVRARAVSAGLTVPLTRRILVVEGDSISSPLYHGYADIYGPLASPTVEGVTWATSGATLATLVAREAALDAMLPTNRHSSKYILSVLIGTNDLNSPSGGITAYIASLAAYCDRRRAAGWITVGITVLPRSDAAITPATFNANRQLLATAQRSWVGVHIDYLVDFALNANMGNDADSDNAAKYIDKIHPTEVVGHGFLETTYGAVIDTI